MKRSNDIIVYQILEICEDGAYKTHVMYKANLNFIKTSKCLELLIGQGLISNTNVNSRVLYKTTERGKEVKDRYKFLVEEMKKLQSISVMSTQ